MLTDVLVVIGPVAAIGALIYFFGDGGPKTLIPVRVRSRRR